MSGKIFFYILNQYSIILIILLIIKFTNQKHYEGPKLANWEAIIFYSFLILGSGLAISKLIFFPYSKTFLAQAITPLERYFWLIYGIVTIHIGLRKLLTSGFSKDLILIVLAPSVATLNKANLYVFFTAIFLLSLSIRRKRKDSSLLLISLFVGLVGAFLFFRFGTNFPFWWKTTFGYTALGYHRWNDFLNGDTSESIISLSTWYEFFLMIFGVFFLTLELSFAKVTNFDTPIREYASHVNEFTYSKSAGRTFNFLTFNYDFYGRVLGQYIGLLRYFLDWIFLSLPFLWIKNSLLRTYYISSVIILLARSIFVFPFGGYFALVTVSMFVMSIIWSFSPKRNNLSNSVR